MKPISAIEPRKPRLVPLFVATFALSTLLPLASARSAAVPEEKPTERQQAISLADAVLQALERNLDITVSRQTRDLLLPDILFEQAKFDPTMSLSGSASRTISPLNRPFFGVTGAQLSSEPTSFDVRDATATLGLTQRILTGASYALTYSPDRTFVPSATGFLFNPGYTSVATLTLTQPLLRDFGLDVNRTMIRVAQNNAKVGEHVFLDKVLTVISTVEQSFWELVFANENLKVAQIVLKAAQDLVVSNRAKAAAEIISFAEVLQAEAAAASRVELVLVAEKAIRDQEDLFRQLLNPGEQELRQTVHVHLTPIDQPIQTLEPISLEEAIDIAIERRPEVLLAQKNVETSDINSKFAKNQLLPSLALTGTLGATGLGKDLGDMLQRNYGGNFYNWTAGFVLSYPLGNRSAWSQYDKRQLEAKNAQALFQSMRQQVIISVREAVRRVQTDFKRIETTRSARILAEKKLQAEQERFNVGLSTTRFVLDFQRDLALARGSELRAIVDFNKSQSNLARHKAMTLDKYQIVLQ